MRYAAFLLLFVLSGGAPAALPQEARLPNAAELRLALEKLNVLGSVLYIAAHPDDENTGLMAFWSKGKMYRAAYLSVTRGDGGQNLIGPEQGSDIGILRSQELLAARRIDGGEQYFTRAVDFGYSKSVAETLEIWGRNEVLADMVRVIRNFRPDVIVTRFPPDDGGHGHHAAATILAREAFTAAADPARFSEQLQEAAPWRARRLLVNRWRPGPQEQGRFPQADIGAFNPYLGRSYNEIAALSRTMHKSQGFGSLGRSGSQLEYFQPLEGEAATADIMEAIDTSWRRLAGGEAVERKLRAVLASFRADEPARSLPQLLELDAQMAALGPDPWVSLKRSELNAVIAACAGLRLEALAGDYAAAPGEPVPVTVSLVQRSGSPLQLRALRLPTLDRRFEIGQEIPHNLMQTVERTVEIPTAYPIAQPYWLRRPPEKGAFAVEEADRIGLAQNPPALPVEAEVTLLGRELSFAAETRFRWVDRVEGERQRPFEVRPPVTADFGRKVVVFYGGGEREISLTLKSHAPAVRGTVRLELPSGWSLSPPEAPFEFARKHDEQAVTFRVRPPPGAGAADARAVVTVDGKEYGYSLVEIVYPHIDPQVHFPEAGLRLVPLESKAAPERIGYIEGSGDDIPEILEEMGHRVIRLGDDMLTAEQLAQCDAVIAGIRAYNTRERLRFAQPLLMDYVKNGGTYIVQYTVSSGLQTEDIGPYPFRIGRGRIVDENAGLRFPDPGHPLLRFPNVISAADFSGWVQERGLYFAEQWDARYAPVFAGRDPGEGEQEGSTLYARHGRGVFIYTGLAWFRQLPAGVPGAFRLFQNLLSAGEYESSSRAR